MSKPLLYAFGGLPIALLGVLIGLSHEWPREEPAVRTETLEPVTQPAPQIEVAPSIPRLDLPPSKTESIAPAPIPIEPEVAQEPRKTQVDGSDEARPSVSASTPPTAEKHRTIESERETETAAIDTPSSPAIGEPPIFGADTADVAAQDPLAKPAEKNGHVIVQRGNTLWRLSRVIYGKGRDYVTIAAANRDTIKDPSLIYPGQVIVIPGAAPPETIDARRKRPLRPDEGGLSLAE